jgi:hypothetical protein
LKDSCSFNTKKPRFLPIFSEIARARAREIPTFTGSTCLPESIVSPTFDIKSRDRIHASLSREINRKSIAVSLSKGHSVDIAFGQYNSLAILLR